MVNKNKAELFEAAKNIVLDEVVGINGVNSENIVFANNIIWPNTPSDKKFKKAPNEVFAVFLSDLHVGSDNFLLGTLLLDWVLNQVQDDESVPEQPKFHPWAV